MRVCEQCGGLQFTEAGESIAGTPCMCVNAQPMTLTEYIREQARVADANSKEWEEGGDYVNAAYRDGMWYAYNDVEARASLQACIKCGMPGAVLHFPGGYLCPGGCKLPMVTDGGSNTLALGQPISLVLLEEARQLLVTAKGEGEYGKGDDWAKRYAAWQEEVRVLGVGK